MHTGTSDVAFAWFLGLWARSSAHTGQGPPCAMGSCLI